MGEKLKRAAEAGLLAGVRILVALAVILLGAGWIVGDYASVRQKASYAFDVIQRSQQAQQQQQSRSIPPSK